MNSDLQGIFNNQLAGKEQGILKLIQGDKKSSLHFLYDGNNLKSLTLASSDKANKIKESGNIKLSFTKDASETVDAKVEIISNKDEVKALFDDMLNRNFTHYKTYDDDLVVLKFN